MAVEYAADGIRANSICPGPVESEMVDSRVAAESERLGVPAETLREAIRKTIPLGRMASVDDIVRTYTCFPSLALMPDFFRKPR